MEREALAKAATRRRPVILADIVILTASFISQFLEGTRCRATSISHALVHFQSAKEARSR
jgi:hypothetical protein